MLIEKIQETQEIKISKNEILERMLKKEILERILKKNLSLILMLKAE